MREENPARTKPTSADTALYHFLLRAAPTADEAGEPEGSRQTGDYRSLATLASALNISRTSVYKWIQEDRIPAHRARRVVEISNGRVTMEEAHPFVYGSDFN